ncbi:LysM peptidoglycan-binding domain-containing protein [Phenylobacterium sp.]|uniref:glycoside hydrolase family protein n=1 Tax=Phenylobacterium sp. TaxID=1871053 RepID=UPI0025F0CCBF|nr:LysM peptidoglycan-binding domain-containing protein [Phenylobacterium sp.]MBX3485515.1 LysM peptidoglycan-binding domain-containing protein [Phenylobacterium sp.]
MPKDGPVHIVKAGDTLSGIARRYGVTLAALKTANPTIRNANAIGVGQRIALPAAPPPPPVAAAPAPAPRAVPATCKVVAGDTLGGIGARYGIGWRAIADLNGIAAPYVLRIGQVLRLRADDGQPPATPTPPVPTPPPPPGATLGGLSPNGADFLFAHEAQTGVSDRPHWPKGASGVTIGPGYDLKNRTRESVVADLTAVGMSAAMAGDLARGCGLRDAAAQAFCTANANIRVTPAQERALLAKAVGPYVTAVRGLIRVPVTQNQFDALVSLAYNIGTPNFRDSTALERLNRGDFAGAAEAMAWWNRSGGKVVQGLVNRRADEVALFRKAGTPAAPPPAPPAPQAPGTAPTGPSYAELVRNNGSEAAVADLDAGRAVLLGLRKQTPFDANGGNGLYDDTMVIVRRNGGGYGAQTFRCNTEPSTRYLRPGSNSRPPDADGDGRPDLGQLKSGQTVEYIRGVYRIDNRDTLALRADPNATAIVQRDVDQDGRISAMEPQTRVKGAAAMHIHVGGRNITGSMGCQTLPPDEHARFFQALEAVADQQRFRYVLLDAPR